jgi:hypothetical protein
LKNKYGSGGLHNVAEKSICQAIVKARTLLPAVDRFPVAAKNPCPVNLRIDCGHGEG